MIVINIGGEGEVPGAINLNSLVETRRPVDAVRRRGPLIQGDFRWVPLASGSVDEIVGNRLPLVGAMARQVAAEGYRVLKRGGTMRWNASTGGGAILLRSMMLAKFADVSIVGAHAWGRKP